MKKYKEMNGLEKIAYRNIRGIFNWEVGGWYNCIQDHCEEFIPDTLEEAKQIIYEESLVDSAGNGWYRSKAAPEEMRFAGKAFMIECIEHLLKTDSDAKEIAEVKNW